MQERDALVSVDTLPLIDALLAAKGIPNVDLLSGFRAHVRERGDELPWPGAGHWNADGHRLAAQIVYEALLERGVLERGWVE